MKKEPNQTVQQTGASRFILIILLKPGWRLQFAGESCSCL
jgi:hypothetical protein